MIEWDTDFKQVRNCDKPFLVKVNNGLFSGGWDFYKAINLNGKNFNADTLKLIEDPHSWARVNL